MLPSHDGLKNAILGNPTDIETNIKKNYKTILNRSVLIWMMAVNLH